MQGLKNVTDYQ